MRRENEDFKVVKPWPRRRRHRNKKYTHRDEVRTDSSDEKKGCVTITARQRARTYHAYVFKIHFVTRRRSGGEKNEKTKYIFYVRVFITRALYANS